MQRRRFIALLGAAATWPMASTAQPSASRPRIGVLIFSTPERDPNTQVFRRALQELGYIEGTNVHIDYRFAAGNPERLPALAAELVRLEPDVLFVLGGDVASFALQATQKIPIVYAMSADPVRLGFAASLAKPGGNATGVTFLSDELAAKRLEVLRAAVPHITHVGFLWNPEHADNELPVAQRAAAILGVRLHSMEARRAADLDAAFNSALQAGIHAVYVVSSRQMMASVPRIVEFATKNRLPLAAGWGAWVQAGALISYGPNVGDSVRRATAYVDRILKGAKPGDLPVEQPTRFELLVNLKTAKALGLAIPESFLLLADKIVE